MRVLYCSLSLRATFKGVCRRRRRDGASGPIDGGRDAETAATGVMEDAQPAAEATTNQELDELRKVARDGGVGETLRELEDTLEETTDMVDELLAAGLRQQAGLRQKAAADTRLEVKDDEVSELRIKLLEAETEVTELKIKHAAQLRRELKAAAANHAEARRELRLWRACTRCAWQCFRPAWCRPCVCRRPGCLPNRRIPDVLLRCMPRRCKCGLRPEDCLTHHARGW